MLPPVLEIYVVWHPLDSRGAEVADALVQHFYGSTFTGLIGGAVDVYVRSPGWRSGSDAPRPISFPSMVAPTGSPAPLLTAIVPVVGFEFAAAVESRSGAWYDYLRSLVAAHDADPDRVGIFPLAIEPSASRGTEIGLILDQFHGIGRGRVEFTRETIHNWCRDLAQGVTQYFGGVAGDRLTVFISHTAKINGDDDAGATDVIARVRALVADTRLKQFFSTNDLQPGRNGSAQLVEEASTSALLAIRTNTYASRPWCQREMLTAKTAGMPIVVLDVLEHHEERGSFLMDHVPRVPVRRDADGWRDSDIMTGLNILVDECLKRTLWNRQGTLAGVSSGSVATWWAPHAPEPATLLAWLNSARLRNARRIRIIHPDPPLGPEERLVLEQIVGLMGSGHTLDVVTPRTLASLES